MRVLPRARALASVLVILAVQVVIAVQALDLEPLVEMLRLRGPILVFVYLKQTLSKRLGF